MVDPRAFYGLAGVPIVVALVQVIKAAAPTLGARWYPAVTLFVAVVFNVGLAAAMGSDPILAVLVGLVVGLAASGLYSHVVALAAPSGASGAPSGPSSTSHATTIESVQSSTATIPPSSAATKEG